MSSKGASDATQSAEADHALTGPPPCADLPMESRTEALLMVADRPMPDSRTAELLGATVAQVRSAVDELNQRYEKLGCAFRIESVAGGRQVMTKPEFAPLIARLKGVREQGRLTHAALETLAVIAYRQPILRADLESIRGVACGEVLRGLMDRRLIKIVGRAEEVGRPMLYGTTGEFLKQFGIGRLEELPNAKDLRL
ncbi:MAG: SMC-Scp complex subunit ScpB [Phycisphaerae bacterium]|nr:SMC-Scp complex subunit ScpB [Phycisphaerae bacterium]